MGCAGSKHHYPNRIDLPLDGEPAWRCATLQSRKKEICVLRVDASTEAVSAELKEPERPLEPGETLTLRVEGRNVTARVGTPCTYDPGTKLLALLGGELVTAVVRKRLSGNQHRLELDDGSTATCDLNPFNHSLPGGFASAAAYQQACKEYVTALHNQLATVEDAITGNTLILAEQLIHITTHVGEGATGTGFDGVQREGWSSVEQVAQLAELLLAPSPKRPQGTHESQGVLIRADPGTGKTWSMQQLAHTIAGKLASAEHPGGVMLLPLLVPVQQLAKSMGEPNPLLSWVASKFEGAQRDAIQVAYELRALIVLLDGVDEAAGKREAVEDLVLKSLVPMGQRVVVSSRPEVCAAIALTPRA